DLTLSGSVAATAPEITVRLNGTSLTDGQAVNFGSTPQGTPITQTFTVVNDGNAALSLSAINAASMPAGFTLLSNLGATSLSPGQSTTFSIRLDATTAGTFSGPIQFANNDSDENPFDLTLQGTVSAALGGPSALYRLDDSSGTTATDSS